MLCGSSRGKHRLKDLEGARKRSGRQAAEPLGKSFDIDSTNLIHDNETVLPTKSAGDAKRIRVSAFRQRRNNDCPNMGVQVIRRHDYAGARSTNLTATRRVQLHEKYIAAPHIDDRQSTQVRITLASAAGGQIKRERSELPNRPPAAS